MAKKRKDMFGNLIRTGAGIGMGTMIATKIESIPGVTSTVMPAFRTAARMMQPAAVTGMGVYLLDITKRGLKVNKRRREIR